MTNAALEPEDERRVVIEVAGPAALLVAKLHKLGERRNTPHRMLDKDAHDVYRLLVAVDTAPLAERVRALTADDLAGESTEIAMRFLSELFAERPGAFGSAMAGQAEQLIGEPAVVSASVAALAGDLLSASVSACCERGRSAQLVVLERRVLRRRRAAELEHPRVRPTHLSLAALHDG